MTARTQTAQRFPRSIEKDLALLAQSESFGAALFETSARQARAPERRHAWSALARLERQTQAGLRSFVAQTGARIDARPRLIKLVERGASAAFASLPWHAQLRLTLRGTDYFLPTFHRLADAFTDTEHGPFFAYVVAHELAIAAFARAELEHGHDSLQLVSELVGGGAALPWSGAAPGPSGGRA